MSVGWHKEPSKRPKWHAPKIVEMRYPRKIDGTESWDHWVKAMMADGRLSDREKFILTRLALHFNLKTGRCDPTHDLLALECSIPGDHTTARDLTRRAIRKAEKLGWIWREYRHGGTQRGAPHEGRQLNRSNQYELRIPNNLFDGAVTILDGDERGDKSRGARGLYSPPEQGRGNREERTFRVLRTRHHLTVMRALNAPGTREKEGKKEVWRWGASLKALLHRPPLPGGEAMTPLM